ncbi:MAG TPA: peptidase M61 [Ignavibacteria bacterium]|nr:peptidase M61 [Ignavibacteria bacterium]HMQ97819.1 peptidase M61 [Ignavibacteria bacterium]
MKSVKNIIFIVTLLFSAISVSYSQGELTKQTHEPRTIAEIDLTMAASDHSLIIEVEPPKINSSSIRYYMPKIVPGTYVINNFGRFISDFAAVDIEGKELVVNRIDTNTWEILSAERLHKIRYRVEDTYNSESTPVVFEPTGTCIDSGKVFMLNNFTLIGYFDGFKDMPYTVSVKKPDGFYGSTSMPLAFTEDGKDVYYPKNYFDLHDNPMMYTIPDTASVMVNNTRVLLSVYSPNKKITANYLAEHTAELFKAQGEYLGGELPADKYSVLVYLSDAGFRSNAAGALEHFKSTTFCYPEVTNEEFIQPFRDVVSHEFFHIVTPLGIHSKEIGDFDFINPVMSKHLWLYEGSTEYYAIHSQVKHGIITQEQFFNKVQQKMYFSMLYLNDTLPFTELSKGALDKYKSQYINVYQKGALINMCLDLYLLKLSGGKYGLQQLKNDLGKKFGPDEAFDDEELFDIITEMTYPEIREFFRSYVEGNKKIPYKQFLEYAGYEYFDKLKKKVPAMIGAALQYNDSGTLEVVEVYDFGRQLGLKTGDNVIAVNGKEVNTHNFRFISRDFEMNAKPGDVVEITVMRKSNGASLLKVILKAETYMVEKEEQFVLQPVKAPTAEQLMIRKAWIDK